MTDIVERLNNLLKADPDPAMCRLYATCKAEIERLQALLAEMPDLIKDLDGGNPETSTGWASEELLDLWMRVHSALEHKP